MTPQVVITTSPTLNLAPQTNTLSSPYRKHPEEQQTFEASTGGMKLGRIKDPLNRDS